MSTPKKFLTTLSIIFYAIVAGPIIMGILFYTTTTITNTNQNETAIFTYLFPIIGMAGIFIGKFLYSKFITALRNKETLEQKLAGFQTASLIQYSLIEGPALLNIIGFSHTGNLLFLTIGGTLIIYLFLQRPTKDKIEKDLALKGDHKKQFNNSEATYN